MSVPGVEEIDGVLHATARGNAPPTGWTTNFEQLGGDENWRKNGFVATVMAAAGISATNMKPLYAMEAWMGCEMLLFEAGSPTTFYLCSPTDGALHEITALDTLEEIVAWMNDEDKGGWSSIPTEQLL